MPGVRGDAGPTRHRSVPSNHVPGQSCAETRGAPSWYAATALDGLPTRLAWLPARLARPRFIDREGAAGQGRAVEGVNGRLRRAVVRHFDEAKAPRPTGFTVGHDPDRIDAAIRLEELAEVLLRGSKSQVTHKDIHATFSRGTDVHLHSGIPPSPDI